MMNEREVCYGCRKARVMCYCADVKPFASDPLFIILIHPKETRKAINTGRMAFRTLTNSKLLVGDRFDENETLRAILNDPSYQVYVLFPGEGAQDIAELPRDETKQDVFLVLDATWAMAKKMYKHSTCLQSLPLVMFTPPKPSGFRIRQQPGLNCYSTLETIHHIIEVHGQHPRGEHHGLLEIFKTMVQRQIDYENSHA